MRRVTKKLIVFISGVLFTCLYCEVIIYYVVIAQCGWPPVEQLKETSPALKALIIADTHLLGPRKGHWFDKLRREWQMHQAFQTIVTLHSPEVVFVLGDLFDEGEWSNDAQFRAYVKRFFELFSIPSDVTMHVVVGNHDIGFHNYMRRGSGDRFNKLLNAPSVQFVTIKDNHFVLLNSMAMEGDSCRMCTEARKQVENISGILKCSEYPSQCDNMTPRVKYSRPILMQHFPLYRYSDSVCTEPDAPPLPERDKPFRLKIDALSKESTEYLISKIKPRAVFGGHTHHGCLLHHSFGTSSPFKFDEYSVPSFSWRNRLDPKFMLVAITPEDYAVNKCGLPKETTMVITAFILLLIFFWYTIRRRPIKR